MNSFRKHSVDQDISLANSEEKVRRANPKSLTVNPSPQRKSIFRPPTTSGSGSGSTQQPQQLQQQSSMNYFFSY